MTKVLLFERKGQFIDWYITFFGSNCIDLQWALNTFKMNEYVFNQRTRKKMPFYQQFTDILPSSQEVKHVPVIP